MISMERRWWVHACLPSIRRLTGVQVDKEGPGMDDAAGFFAKVFGGDRFEDYVRTPYLHYAIERYNLHTDWTNIAHEGDDQRRLCCDDRRRES